MRRERDAVWRCEGGARGRAPLAGYPHLPRPRPYSATQPPVGAEAAVTADANKPHRLPPGRTDLGCRMVADGLSRGLAEGSWNTISLQISGGPQGSRTPDLRRGTAPSARQRTDPALGRPTSVAAPSTRGGAAHRRRRGARSRPALK